MSEQVGIKETKEFLTFLAKTGNATSKSLADGKVDEQDIGNLIEPLGAAVPAFQGIGEMGKEWKDLSEAEALELKEHVAKELVLDPKDEQVEKLTELLFSASVQVTAAIMAVVEAKKEKPAES